MLVKKCLKKDYYDDQDIFDLLSENTESVMYASYGLYLVFDGECLWLSDTPTEAHTLGEIIGRFFYEDGSYIFRFIAGREEFI
ncbi:MAG: hypothetical protein ACP5L4_01965 [Thermoplasmata archaeon]